MMFFDFLLPTAFIPKRVAGFHAGGSTVSKTLPENEEPAGDVNEERMMVRLLGEGHANEVAACNFFDIF